MTSFSQNPNSTSSKITNRGTSFSNCGKNCEEKIVSFTAGLIFEVGLLLRETRYIQYL